MDEASVFNGSVTLFLTRHLAKHIKPISVKRLILKDSQSEFSLFFSLFFSVCLTFSHSFSGSFSLSSPRRHSSSLSFSAPSLQAHTVTLTHTNSPLTRISLTREVK